ncbi:MAG: DUF2791 family P-loop domain-containing protein [Clostridia bacterium]|nr:DUF2791 family P-loop domain-containing protein [Clostridia bacterium]
MRNFKKMLVVICVFALLTVGCVFAAFAADSSAGTVEDLNKLIATAEGASTVAAKYNAILEVANYINTKKINPSAEGYDAAIAAAHKVTVAGADAYVAVVDVDGITAADAYTGMTKIAKLLGLFELPEDTEGLAELRAKLDSATVRAVGVLIGEIDADIETTLTTGQNQIVINRAKRIIAEFPLSGDSYSIADLEATLAELEGDVGGFDFAKVLGEYYMASLSDDSEKKTACLRWLRGEFATKTEASTMLGFRVSTVIDDDNWYNFIKLFASLAVKLGYSGLILFIDECVNLYKIPNRISRESNYEKILTIFNDTLQGKAKNLGVIFGGTPQFLEDTRRGLFSYDALKSRLSDSRYSELGYQNLSTPVIRLRRLSDNELLALVKRLAKLFAQREGKSEISVTDAEIEMFITHALSRAGAEEMITPREIIRDFLTILNIMRDNPGASFPDLVHKVSFTAQEPASTPGVTSGMQTKNKISLFDIDI